MKKTVRAPVGAIDRSSHIKKSKMIGFFKKFFGNPIKLPAKREI
jgi:hypothetical protein